MRWTCRIGATVGLALLGACGGGGDGDNDGSAASEAAATTTAAAAKQDRSGKSVCELIPPETIKTSTRYTHVTFAAPGGSDHRDQGRDLSSFCSYKGSATVQTSAVSIGVYQWNDATAAKASYDADAQKVAQYNPQPVGGIGDSAYVGKSGYSRTELRALFGDTVVYVGFSGPADEAGIARDVEGLKQFAPVAMKALEPLLP